ncbi:MAG: sigma-70 family RNA polymerase sigma factor [Saprospiraceae bacterium]|nr:sigma-70 family RNA polymerase sigma factor [Saprospiraceae bacterium]
MHSSKPSHEQHYEAKNNIRHQGINAMSEAEFSRFYFECKKDFIGTAKKGRKEDFEDAFHDAFLSLLNNPTTQQSFKLSESQKSYVLGIARNKWLMIRRKMQRLLLLGDIDDSKYPSYENHTTENDYWNPLLRSLNHLNRNAREILKRFYFLEQDLRTIASKMQLKDANVAAVTLSRARTRLKAFVISQIN